jgi:pseudouridine kinase
MGKRFLCIGGAVIDRKYVAQTAIVPGSSMPARSVSGMGGVARNVAENLARLGNDVAFVSRVGADDGGLRLSRGLAELGIDVSGLDVSEADHTAEYVAFLDRDGDLHTAMADMAILDGIGVGEVSRWRMRFGEMDMVFADTNLQADVLAALMDAARSSGARLAIDAISVPKAARLPASLAGVSLLFLNMQEAPAVLGLAEGDGNDPASLAKALVRRGAERVVLTLGEKGALAHDGTRPHAIAAEGATVVDVTGAGDSLAAGVLHALGEGRSLPDAVAFGAHLAARTLGVMESVDPGISPVVAARFFAGRPSP